MSRTWQEREALKRERRAKDHPSTHNCMTTGVQHGRQTDEWLMKVDVAVEQGVDIRAMIETRLQEDAQYWVENRDEERWPYDAQRWAELTVKYGLEMFDRVLASKLRDNEELKARANDDYEMWGSNLNDIARPCGVGGSIKAHDALKGEKNGSED